MLISNDVFVIRCLSMVALYTEHTSCKLTCNDGDFLEMEMVYIEVLHHVKNRICYRIKIS